MRAWWAMAMVVACTISFQRDGYDRFDLCFGFLMGLSLTWLMGYKRKQ